MLKQGSSRKGCNASSRTLMSIKAYQMHSSDNSASIKDFFIALDCPLSLSCYMLYNYGEFEQLVQKEIDPGNYLDSDSFQNDFAAISFLRKNASLKTGINVKKVALDSFWAAENKCKEVNQLIGCNVHASKNLALDVYTLSRIQRKIHSILGEFDIDYVLDKCRWGPGSTLSVTGEETSAATKFDVDCDITRDAYYLFQPVLTAAYPKWKAIEMPRFKTGNKIITVPKNAKTDRTIAIEPGLNSWIQLGIGSLLRKRLRSAGYNLNSDLKNIRGAYLGSVDDSLATIDFKAASDTISSRVVELLLPPVWFTVLNAARSHYFTLDGQTYRSDKFSTMGNGFTFELESLLFLAIGLALCEINGADDSGVSIFGDDLVLPSSLVKQLTAVCSALGFTINQEKSFSSGYFRESCGSYYFNGVDVKPIFLKKDVSHVKDVYRLANAIRSLSHRRTAKFGCDIRFRSMWSRIVYRVPEPIRFFGPVSSGDAAIHENIHESTARRAADGWCGYYYTGIPSVALSIEKDTHGLLQARVSRPSGTDSFGNNCSLRAKTKIIYKKNMFVSQWYDLGPWMAV